MPLIWESPYSPNVWICHVFFRSSACWHSRAKDGNLSTDSAICLGFAPTLPDRHNYIRCLTLVFTRNPNNNNSRSSNRAVRIVAPAVWNWFWGASPRFSPEGLELHKYAFGFNHRVSWRSRSWTQKQTIWGRKAVGNKRRVHSFNKRRCCLATFH